MLRLEVGYPGEDDEVAILERRVERGTDTVPLDAVVTTETLLAMQAGVERIHVADSITRYIVALVSATRASPRLQVGASPRGSLALVKLSRARAALDGRSYVIPDDVKSVAVPALAHRLILRPELWVQRVRAESVVEEAAADEAPAEEVADEAPADGAASDETEDKPEA